MRLERGQAGRKGTPHVKIPDTVTKYKGLKWLLILVLDFIHSKLPLFDERTSKSNIFFYCCI